MTSAVVLCATAFDLAQIHGINMQRFFCTGALALVVLWTGGSQASEAPLGLSEAVQIAVTAEDPALIRFDVRADALEDRAIADAQLPDPTVRGRFANFPTDTFRFDQENMTQIQAGLRQEFPAGRTLALRGERRRAEAGVERARKDLVLREIELAVRLSWFDLFYWRQAQVSVHEARRAVGDAIKSLHASFASGTLTTQHVLRAELELSLLDDRLTEMKWREEAARADLSRYVQAEARRPSPARLPDLQVPRSLEEMEASLTHHPEVLVADSEIGVFGRDIELVEQTYKPSWALEGGYGGRGGGRADFASVGITLSIPLFTGDRQDRRLSAAMKERSAARLDRAAKLLDLRRDLERAYSDWSLLGDRVALYGNEVVKRAEETAEASISTYANGRTDFAELIRSQLALLEVELKRVQLRTEQGKAWATLDFLAGDIQ